ncbi:MAG: bifunctional ornithine acetyltransferase/N-acetylglutamate synthase [Porticoccaceae bacterium]|nr:MAG: bifunctional ornithine acetyltransferase/N-acetylglutamate synthase [Porticoccaceae bacterium]
MAVGEERFPDMKPVPGFKLGTTSAGIKTLGRKDLVIMEIVEGGTIAGVFTQNAFCAAPVQLTKAYIMTAESRYLVTNTGNANAGTGESGRQDAKAVCQAVAELTGVSTEAVLPFSTGVIGEPLPVEKIITALPAAYSDLSESGWADAAAGILTTDTRPKSASVQLELAGKTITITGIAKGSGMIKPNMATMLSYVATDAVIASDLLESLVSSAVDVSFNRITVDGDTSTNDCAMLIATGASGVNIGELSDVDQDCFEVSLQELFISLAHQIIKDGEGSTKFVAVEVTGGMDSSECLAVAYTVAESPLVKTALFASDPNWGRILAAIGRAGLPNLDVEVIQVYLDEVLIAEKGGRAESYLESAGQAVMDKEKLSIRIHLNRGDSQETVWTTDLSHDYIKINAEYRT